LKRNARVIQADCLAYLRTTPDIDVVFLDPPYASNLHLKTLEALAPHVHTYSTVICETEKKSPLPESVGLLTVKKEHLYGKTKVAVYRGRRDDL
jgi:16S rRNA (guanine966-N2)-methyltransferase